MKSLSTHITEAFVTEAFVTEAISKDIKSLDELKLYDKNAYKALITLWAEESLSSEASARKYLKDDFGYRYQVKVIDNVLSFTDTESKDTWNFINNDWICKK